MPTKKHEEGAGTDVRVHSYVVRSGNDQPPPLTIAAESFEVEKDTITFTRDGQTCAVVRGGWTSVVQQPDPVSA